MQDCPVQAGRVLDFTVKRKRFYGERMVGVLKQAVLRCMQRLP